MSAYYNEIDPFAAAWLRELIKAGHIAPGVVDERSITDVSPNDLDGFAQCHFFAGIGVWSYALRQAGWADDRPVWTGSCPCQSFSAAGKGAGFDDPRHLWPTFYRLVKECRPNTVFGEQVEAAIRHGWLDLVQADLEREDYAFGAVVFPAAGIGAPHIRSRLYWVADAASEQHDRSWNAGERRRSEHSDGRIVGRMDNNQRIGRGEGRHNDTQYDGEQLDAVHNLGSLADSMPTGRPERGAEPRGGQASGSGEFDELDNSIGQGSQVNTAPGQSERGTTGWTSASIGLADTSGGQFQEQVGRQKERNGTTAACAEYQPTSPTNGFWRDADWIFCRDGKWRPVEPGTFPLVNGATNRVGLLRGAGNAIVAPQAQAFIKSFMEIEK